MEIHIKKPFEIQTINEYVETWQKLREELIHSLNKVPDSIFTEPKEGWSASQIGEHLYLSQYLFAIFIPKVINGTKGYNKEQLNSIPYDDLYEKLSKPYSRIKNPDAVTPKNNWDKNTLIENLKKSMELLVKNLKDLDLDILKNRGMMHGIFGPISILDYTYNLIVHELGHLKTLKLKYNL